MEHAKIKGVTPKTIELYLAKVEEKLMAQTISLLRTSHQLRPLDLPVPRQTPECTASQTGVKATK